MNTYMVEVNNKFMVRIEIEGSACAAEHYFLDNFKGVWGALAFDQKTMKTDCFIGCMMNDELTTLDTLCEKLTNLDNEDGQLEALASRIADFNAEIDRLTKEREGLEADYRDMLNHYMKLRKRLNVDKPQ